MTALKPRTPSVSAPVAAAAMSTTTKAISTW
jgi:hypothetical protein